MPHFDILRKAEPKKTFRVSSVIGTYDLQSSQAVEHFVGNITPPHNGMSDLSSVAVAPAKQQ